MTTNLFNLGIHAASGPKETRGKRADGGKISAPPRERQNLDKKRPHNSFPGGKTLRKRLAKLSVRRKGYDTLGPSAAHAETRPGSMRG